MTGWATPARTRSATQTQPGGGPTSNWAWRQAETLLAAAARFPQQETCAIWCPPWRQRRLQLQPAALDFAGDSAGGPGEHSKPRWPPAAFRLASGVRCVPPQRRDR